MELREVFTKGKGIFMKADVGRVEASGPFSSILRARVEACFMQRRLGTAFEGWSRMSIIMTGTQKVYLFPPIRL